MKKLMLDYRGALCAGLVLMTSCLGEDKEGSVTTSDDTGASASSDDGEDGSTGDGGEPDETGDSGEPDETGDSGEPDDTGGGFCSGGLPGVRSFKVCGDMPGQLAGFDVSVAGPDAGSSWQVAVGSYNSVPEQRTDVYIGQPESSGPLSAWTRIGGEETLELRGFGIAVELGSDFDGDGYRDLAVGAPYAWIDSYTASSRVLVYYGPFDTDREHMDFDAAVEGNSLFGYTLASVPDIDGDGDDELLAGTWANAEGWGKYAALLLGPVSSISRSDVATLYQEAGGGALQETAAADMDGDGIVEVLISGGASVENGALWVVPASERGEVDLTDHPGVRGISDRPIRGYRFGHGDTTGDGYCDLVIDLDDAPVEGGYISAVAVMAGPITETASTADAIAIISDEEEVTEVPRVAGDLNGDGVQGDLVVAMPWPDDTIHVFPAPLEGSYTFSASSQVTMAEVSGDTLGNARSVTALPDIDGDGLDEVLIGAPLHDEGGEWAGAAYILFGGSW